jgi:hypothetical protein
VVAGTSSFADLCSDELVLGRLSLVVLLDKVAPEAYWLPRSNEPLRLAVAGLLALMELGEAV